MLILAASIALIGGLAVGAFAYESLQSKPTRVVSGAPEATYTPVEEPIVTRDELLQAVNAERAKVGVAPLAMDETLNQTAQTKADDMLKFNYNDHVNPITGKRGIEYPQEAMVGRCNFVSENLVWVDSGLKPVTTRGAISEWLTSKPHREAMLNPKYTLTGFGVTKPKVVQHFCEPL